MAREIDGDTGDALESPQLSPIGLVELEFETGTVRLWTGYGTIASPDGREWVGVGALGQFGTLDETADSRATGVMLELSGVGDPIDVDGVPIDVLAIALGEEWQQRTARVYYGVLDASLQWVGDLFLLREGVMDQMEILEGEGANIRLSVESAFLDNQRAEARRLTAEDQRAEFFGDAGCDQVAALQDKAVVWNLG